MEFEKKVVELDVNDVLPNRFQPRIKFNEDSINELSDSIKEHGVIQPIVVRAMGDKYEIIAGERRYKASLLAGKQTIPAVITNLNDKDSAEVALIENVQRKDLTPIEEAISYKKILDMGYLTQDELATKLGKNQSTVANKLRLLNLAEEVQEAVLEEKISERHARSLLKLQNHNDQIAMLNKIIDGRLTVRKADEEIAKILKPKPIVIDTNEESNRLNINNIDNNTLINKKGKNTMMNDDYNPFISEPVPTVIESVQNENSTNIGPIQSKPVEPNGESIFIEEEPANNQTDLFSNPGFMDVNKIEQNATDINTPKQVVDMNTLLEPTKIPDVPIEQPEISIDESIGQNEENNIFDMPKENKFFKFPIEEEDKEQIIPKLNEDIEPVKVSSEVDELSNQTNRIDSQDSLFNFNFDNVVSQDGMLVEEPITEENKSKPSSIINESLVNTPSELNSFKSVSTPENWQTIKEPIYGENNNQAFSLEQMNNLSGEQSNLIESLNEIQSIDNNTSKIENFGFNDIIAPSMQTSSLYGNNIMNESTTIPDFKDAPIIGEELPIPTMNDNSAVKRNISEAINIVRNCVNELEKIGFKIDTEEVDFETIYQIVIKINKN